MLRCILYFTAFLFMIGGKYVEGADAQQTYGELLTSRFIVTADKKTRSIVSIPLRESWWSRPHEYAWAGKFAGSDYIALDAACGISHPFKWLLGQKCKEAWACDADPRIDTPQGIIQETYRDLGDAAYQALIAAPELLDQVKLIKASICQLPPELPQFDRIFCISTLEHLDAKDQMSALSEFSRFLAPDGLLVMTVDYPEIKPEALFEMAASVGLVPAGDVDLNRPLQGALTNGYLSIYRCVLTHAD